MLTFDFLFIRSALSLGKVLFVSIETRTMATLNGNVNVNMNRKGVDETITIFTFLCSHTYDMCTISKQLLAIFLGDTHSCMRVSFSLSLCVCLLLKSNGMKIPKLTKLFDKRTNLEANLFAAPFPICCQQRINCTIESMKQYACSPPIPILSD